MRSVVKLAASICRPPSARRQSSELAAKPQSAMQVRATTRIGASYSSRGARSGRLVGLEVAREQLGEVQREALPVAVLAEEPALAIGARLVLLDRLEADEVLVVARLGRDRHQLLD